MAIIEARVCFRRVTDFLCASEIDPLAIEYVDPKPQILPPNNHKNNNNNIQTVIKEQKAMQELI